MNVERRIEPDFRFDTGVRDAQYAETPQGQTQGVVQKPLLPGGTTVTEALSGVFPEGQHVEGEIMRALVEGNLIQLRTEHGFAATAANPEAERPYVLRAGYLVRTREAVLAVRLEEREVDLVALEAAFQELWAVAVGLKG